MLNVPAMMNMEEVEHGQCATLDQFILQTMLDGLFNAREHNEVIQKHIGCKL
jgi:hypothetical protein